MQIVPGATQSICDVAESSARGDQRAALAMLLAAYFEMASRIVTSEQASSQWLLAMSAYCEAGAQRLGSAAKFYGRGSRASGEDEQRYYLGRLANAAHEGASFADVLKRQFESLGLVEYDDDNSDGPDDIVMDDDVRDDVRDDEPRA
jgi:hypothetical protein